MCFPLFVCVVCRYAAVQMALCAAPAVALMLLGGTMPGQGPAAELTWVWMGLTCVMSLRVISIWLPYALKREPFVKLWPSGAASPRLQPSGR